MVFFGGGGLFETRRCSVAIDFQFSFRICHYAGSDKQDYLKLNGTYHILVCADDVNILVENKYTIKKNRVSLVVANKETRLEVNGDKTKYMVMSGDQNAGRSNNIKIDYSSLERVEQFQYFGINLTNQNYVQEEIVAACSQTMLVIIRCRIFCISVCYTKIH